MITNETQAAATCADISSIGHGKWAAMGLNPEYIQGMGRNQRVLVVTYIEVEPICTSSDSNPDPNPQDSITNIIYYTSQIFLTQILGSFDHDALQYMCGQVDFFLLNKFMLNSTGIVGAICHSVGKPLPPQPFSPGHRSPEREAAAHAVTNSASILYALMLATGLTTDTELNVLCAHAPEYVANLHAELMNGTAFQDTACSVNDPISVEEAVNELFTWTTRIFITMIENISNVDGWLDWLCSHVDTGKLNAVNLNGEVVKQQI